MQTNDDLWYLDDRELSWLKFNRRVLSEADCITTPLMERLKFISIFTSNLDEFYMVRVGRLIMHETDESANKQINQIYQKTQQLYLSRDSSFETIQKDLNGYKIQLLQFDQLKKSEQLLILDYFQKMILPMLSPYVIEEGQPFPHVPNKQLHIAVRMKKGEDTVFGLIPVPANSDRIVFIHKNELRYMLLEDMILYYSKTVFHMFEILDICVVRVTRNADIITEKSPYDTTIDYRQYIKRLVKRRARLAVVRLEIQANVNSSFVEFLCKWFGVKREQVFYANSPLDLSYVNLLESMLPKQLKEKLLYPPYQPYLYHRGSMIANASKKDILLSYPYESIDNCLNLIKEAAFDPCTTSIKITLYRIARKSRLAEYLITAAENGKDVRVIMELRARFDEPNNIEWAQRLEEGGCKVLYGYKHYKIHSKICLITRKIKGKTQYITQIGTGNYNETTAKIYTDLSLITANNKIGKDADLFFRSIEKNKLSRSFQYLWVAPRSLENKICSAIDEEIKKAQKGKEARVIMKLNSLTDRKMIDKLIEASNAGVKVRLIVRGICCLIPGIKGYTENIIVISIVGRFLEHSRIYCFGTGKKKKMYISSADMMVRNLRRRVETACPIFNNIIKERLYQMLLGMLCDSVKARVLKPNGEYVLRKKSYQWNSQEYFMHYADKAIDIFKHIPIKANQSKK